MKTSLWVPFQHLSTLRMNFFLISSCSFPCCKLWALSHLYCAPLRRIWLCFQFSEAKAGCSFFIVQNTCWYRDLDKSHKTNGKNWSTSYFLTLTELRMGEWWCHRNSTSPCCSFGIQQQESFRKEVGRGSPIVTGFGEAGISPIEVNTQACII